MPALDWEIHPGLSRVASGKQEVASPELPDHLIDMPSSDHLIDIPASDHLIDNTADNHLIDITASDHLTDTTPHISLTNIHSCYKQCNANKGSEV